jgi:ribosomal protein S12
MPNSKLLSLAFPASVAAFGLYNTATIGWELKKPNSTTCPKCARTRMIVGVALAAWGSYVVVKEMI